MPSTFDEKHKDFDKLKKETGKNFSKVSVFNVKGQANLIYDCFRCYIYSALQNRLDLNACLQDIIIKVNNFVKQLIIPEKGVEAHIKGPLDIFIEGGTND